MTASNTNLAKKFLKSDNIFFTFLRSSVSSQISSWVDMGVGFILFAWVNLLPWVAAACGAVAGGIVNCIVGYKFTYHADNVSKRAVTVKFLMVWLGSLILNTWGTDAVYYLLQRWTWLETIGFNPKGYFAAARLGVSLVVSLAWNFLLQRRFVFRPNRFDNVIIRIIDRFAHKKS